MNFPLSRHHPAPLETRARAVRAHKLPLSLARTLTRRRRRQHARAHEQAHAARPPAVTQTRALSPAPARRHAAPSHVHRRTPGQVEDRPGHARACTPTRARANAQRTGAAAVCGAGAAGDGGGPLARRGRRGGEEIRLHARRGARGAGAGRGGGRGYKVAVALGRGRGGEGGGAAVVLNGRTAPFHCHARDGKGGGPAVVLNGRTAPCHCHARDGKGGQRRLSCRGGGGEAA